MEHAPVTARLRTVVRFAQPSDHHGLRALATALAQGPLLSRYGSDPQKLGEELCQLSNSQAPVQAHREALLVAVSDSHSDSYSDSHSDSSSDSYSDSHSCLGLQTVRPVWGLARFTYSGMFGSLGGYLKLIAVADTHTGQGIGAQLLAAVEDHVRAHSRDLFLLASHFNDSAHRFYDRHGYRQIGRLPDYVRTEITELLFWKRLRPT